MFVIFYSKKAIFPVWEYAVTISLFTENVDDEDVAANRLLRARSTFTKSVMASTVIQHFDVQTYDIYRSRFKQLSGGYYSDLAPLLSLQPSKS